MDPKQIPQQNPEIILDRKSKILFIVIAILIAGSVAVTFWRYMIKRDYIVQAQADCDPTTEKCFVWTCDPNATDSSEKCTGNPDNDTWYYKNVRRNAKNIPLCDPNSEDCTALVCDPGEKDCSEELCTAENVPEGEKCNDPVQYNIDNPPEEDSEECAPDDDECLSAQDEAVECEEGDEECAAEDTTEECAPDDQECLDAQNTDESACAPDDESCMEDQNAPANSKSGSGGAASEN